MNEQHSRESRAEANRPNVFRTRKALHDLLPELVVPQLRRAHVGAGQDALGGHPLEVLPGHRPNAPRRAFSGVAARRPLIYHGSRTSRGDLNKHSQTSVHKLAFTEPRSRTDRRPDVTGLSETRSQASGRLVSNRLSQTEVLPLLNHESGPWL